jgi:NitT/TauT family transport system substrate-binding protein
MVKKIFSWTSMVMIAALLLQGCSTFSKPSVEHSPLKVEYTLWPGDYTLLIAQEKGFFKKHGVEVEPVYYEDFSRALIDLTAKRIDVGLFSVGDLLMVTQVAEVQGIAVYDSGGTSIVMARPEITDVAGLKGKKIGVNIGTYAEMIVRQMLKGANLTIDDVTLVEAGPEAVPDKLANNEISAGYVWAPYDKKAQQAGNKPLFTSKELGELGPDVITIRKELVQERPENVKAFLTAWFEAHEYRASHPAECNEIIARLTKQPVGDINLDENIKLYTREDNYRLFDPINQASNNSNIYKTAQINLDFQIATGGITSSPDLVTLLTPKYLP